MGGKRKWGIARGLSRALSGKTRRAQDLFPPTLLGLGILLASAAALRFFAYEELDLVLLIVGYGAVVYVALSLLMVCSTALALRWSMRGARPLGPLALETEMSLPSGFSMAALRWLPLVQVRLEWERPPGVVVSTHLALGRATERVRFAERGDHEEILRRVVIEDAFGLARVGFRLRDERVLRVSPHLGALSTMPLLSSFSGGDVYGHPHGTPEGDYIELRRYAPGDPARLIHWRVFGRTRKLMIRKPERALTETLRTAAYLVAGDADGASAGAARAALRHGALGADWIFGADGGEATDSSDEAAALVRRSVEHRGRGGARLEAFAARAERGGPCSYVLFVPPTPGDWTERVLAFTRARPGRCRLVIGVDGIDDSAERRGWRRFLLRADKRTRSSRDALERTLSGLRGTNLPIRVVDRLSGRVLSDEHLQKPSVGRGRRAA